MAKKLKKKVKEPIEELPTIVDLIFQFNEGTLPEDQLAFKYESSRGESLIHRDELKKEAAMANLYGGQYIDRIIGMRTSITDNKI